MGKKILVVDDDVRIVQLLEKRLTAHGFAVITAGDGREGVAKAKREMPDLIIMDIMMPEVDGTEAARMIREDAKTKNIPLIYLTALKEEHDSAVESTIGPDIVMGKPFNADELLSKIKWLIGE
ncbi:MAG: response regulator [Candidatus Omnitrophica bacterium]|nr:response regulator [Candidatus Omnitrophota bacterium]MDD5671802.1 response regulator [Candidatus Omnitrophota bacterium]